MRGMRGVGGGTKRKRLASSGRNVEGLGYIITDVGGERQLRCKLCEALVPVNRWWLHGTSEDPHATTEVS